MQHDTISMVGDVIDDVASASLYSDHQLQQLERCLTRLNNIPVVAAALPHRLHILYQLKPRTMSAIFMLRQT